MSVKMQEAVEMSAENEAAEEISAAVQNNENASEETVVADSAAELSSELATPGWSIVSFEGVAMRGLSYDDASRWMEKLDQQKISGLCIVTDEAAARMSK